MNEPTRREFPTLAILTVATGRMLVHDIGQVYQLLGWMTDDEPFTHQLPRFSRECKPWLLRWHPHLEDVSERVVKECEAGNAATLQQELVEKLGETMEVQKIPQDDHDRKDGYDELVEMRGTDEGIVIIEHGEPK